MFVKTSVNPCCSSKLHSNSVVESSEMRRNQSSKLGMMLDLCILKYRGVDTLAMPRPCDSVKVLVTLLSHPGGVVYLWRCGQSQPLLP